MSLAIVMHEIMAEAVNEEKGAKSRLQNIYAMAGNALRETPPSSTATPTDNAPELPPAVQECIDAYGRYYAEHHKLGMSIRNDMKYVAEVAMRWKPNGLDFAEAIVRGERTAWTPGVGDDAAIRACDNILDGLKDYSEEFDQYDSATPVSARRQAVLPPDDHTGDPEPLG